MEGLPDQSDGTPFRSLPLWSSCWAAAVSGEVWRAHDTDTDRIVALKLLPPYLSADEQFQQRFRREAHAAARLNNPHVIPIHHYGEIDGRLYVDMRLSRAATSKPCWPTGRWNRHVRCASSNRSPRPCMPPTRSVCCTATSSRPTSCSIDDDFAYLIDFGIARAAR